MSHNTARQHGLAKLGAVLAGYLIAFLAASAAVYYRGLHAQGPDVQASAGMSAFGDAILFVAVFGVVALFPTGLALYFLRPFKKIMDRVFHCLIGYGDYRPSRRICDCVDLTCMSGRARHKRRPRAALQEVIPAQERTQE